MAMIKCKECEKEISTSATKCPHCGMPITKPLTFIVGLIMGVLLVLTLWLMVNAFIYRRFGL